MSLRRTLLRLKRQADGPMVVIPQPQGPPRIFSQRDLAVGYLVALRRMKGEDVDHPICEAARNSSTPHWSAGLYAEEIAEEPPEDLSES
jgi:hypothetical protein